MANQSPASIDIFSPLGCLLMIWAVFLDVLGLFFAVLTLITGGIAAPLEYIPDVLGTITIGIWSWRRDGELKFGKKLMRYLKKYGLEWVPVIGAAPFWTIFVYKDLQK